MDEMAFSLQEEKPAPRESRRGRRKAIFSFMAVWFSCGATWIAIELWVQKLGWHYGIINWLLFWINVNPPGRPLYCEALLVAPLPGIIFETFALYGFGFAYTFGLIACLVASIRAKNWRKTIWICGMVVALTELNILVMWHYCFH